MKLEESLRKLESQRDEIRKEVEAGQEDPDEGVIQMTLEQKLSRIGIKRILVADDTSANIAAAKKAFFKYEMIRFDYASSAKQAIELIQSQKYDLVITDLEMEKIDSGIDVAREALQALAYATIATGRAYDRPDTDPHGPNTRIIPNGMSVKGKKELPRVWDAVLEHTLEYISSPKIQEAYSSERRYKKFIGNGSDIFTDYIITTYKG